MWRVQNFERLLFSSETSMIPRNWPLNMSSLISLSSTHNEVLRPVHELGSKTVAASSQLSSDIRDLKTNTGSENSSQKWEIHNVIKQILAACNHSYWVYEFKLRHAFTKGFSFYNSFFYVSSLDGIKGFTSSYVSSIVGIKGLTGGRHSVKFWMLSEWFHPQRLLPAFLWKLETVQCP